MSVDGAVLPLPTPADVRGGRGGDNAPPPTRRPPLRGDGGGWEGTLDEQTCTYSRPAAPVSVGSVLDRALSIATSRGMSERLHRLVNTPRSWAVVWLCQHGVPSSEGAGAVAGLGRRPSPVEVVGMLSGYRMSVAATRRSRVGCMVCGAKRGWIRRVADAEVGDAYDFESAWDQWTGKRVR